MQEEIFPLKNYEGYGITKTGKVWSYKSNRFLKHSFTNGYKQVCIYVNKKLVCKSIHRLVAETFIPNTENKIQVNHINCIKTDNSIENLEWCTISENITHAYKNGLLRADGENNGCSKLTDIKVMEIKKILNKYSLRDIAKQYGVNHATILLIKQQKTWKHLCNFE